MATAQCSAGWSADDTAALGACHPRRSTDSRQGRNLLRICRPGPRVERRGLAHLHAAHSRLLRSKPVRKVPRCPLNRCHLAHYLAIASIASCSAAAVQPGARHRRRRVVGGRARQADAHRKRLEQARAGVAHPQRDQLLIGVHRVAVFAGETTMPNTRAASAAGKRWYRRSRRINRARLAAPTASVSRCVSGK